MHFHAIAERPAATPHAGVSWLLLGFAVLSLGVHALLFMPGRENVPLDIVHLGTPYIRVTLSEKPQPQADAAPASRPTEHSPRKTDTPPAATQGIAAKTPVPARIPAPPREPQTFSAPQGTPGKPAAQPTAVQPDNLEKRHSAIRSAKSTTLNPSNESQERDDEARQREALCNYLLGELRDQLSRYLTYPQRARRRGWEGEVLLAMDISTQGQLQNIQLIHSSGHATLDRSAMKSLARVERLQLPATARRQEAMNLQLPVVYQLKQN